MWRVHLWNLVKRAVSEAIPIGGSTAVGIVVITILGAAAGFGFQVLFKWWTGGRTKASLKEALKVTDWEPLVAGIAGVLLVWSILVVWQIPQVIYRDHQNLVSDNRKLTQQDKELREELRKREHTMYTTDAAFFNVVNLVQALSSFRSAQQGKPCVIWITSPPDSMQIARNFGQLGASVAMCSTFGPMPPGNEDLDTDVMIGMVPGVVVLHAPRDSKAASVLESALTNQIQLRRSFKPPTVPKKRLYSSLHGYNEDFIWLQFGTNVKWNSELFAKSAGQ